MADLDPKTAETLNDVNEAAARMGISVKEYIKLLDRSNKSLRSFGGEIDYAQKSASKLKNQLDTGAKKYSEISGDLGRLQSAIDNATEEEIKSSQFKQLIRDRDELANKAYRATMLDGAKQVAGQITAGIASYYKAQVMTGIRGLQGEGSPFQVAADLQTSMIDSVAQTTSGVATVAKGVGGALEAIPHPAAQVAAGLLKLGGELLDFGAKQAAEALKFQVEVISKELEKAYKSFQQATGAGALFGGGLTELRKTALAAGLTQEQFSKVIAENSESLALIGGSVADGAKKVGAVTRNFSSETQKGLIKLGISIEDQAQGVTEYMAVLQQTGQLRGRSDAQLAQESQNYLINMKALSALTGEDAKKAQARAKEAAQQAAVKSKLDQLGGESNIKFQNVIKGMPASMQKAAQQMLAFGEVVDPDLAATLGPEAMELIRKSIRDVEDQSVGSTEAVQRYQSNLRSSADAIKDESRQMMEPLGQASLAIGAHGEKAKIAADQYDLATRAQQMGTKDTVESAKDAMNSQDALTNGVADSVVALQNMRKELQETLTPAIAHFAKEVPKILEGLRSKLESLGIIGKDYGKEEQIDAAKAKFDKSMEGSGFFHKWFGLRTTEQKAAEDELMQARGWDTSQSYAGGGIATGALEGYFAKLHGTEAVVPLADGKNIPVDINTAGLAEQIASAMQTSMSRMLSQQAEHSEEQLQIMRDHKDLLERLNFNIS